LRGRDVIEKLRREALERSAPSSGDMEKLKKRNERLQKALNRKALQSQDRKEEKELVDQYDLRWRHAYKNRGSARGGAKYHLEQYADALNYDMVVLDREPRSIADPSRLRSSLLYSTYLDVADRKLLYWNGHPRVR